MEKIKAAMHKAVAFFKKKKLWGLAGLCLGIWIYSIGLAFLCEAASQQSAENWVAFLQTEWAATALSNIALISALLIAAITFFTRKLSIGVGLVSVGLFLLHAINHFKIMFRNEPFYPWDFSLAGEAGNIMSDINFVFEKYMIYAIIYVVVGLAGAILLDIFVMKKLRIRYYKEAIIGAAAVLFMLLGFNQRFSLDYLKENNVYILSWEPLAGYQSYGFVYSFIRSAYDIQVEEPEGYGTETVERLTAEAVERTEREKEGTRANVIVVMNEAYMDLDRAENLDFGRELTPIFNSLSAQYLSGRAMTSEYGGGTANSEFELLTSCSTYGLPAGLIAYMSYVNGEMDSYLSYLNGQGYNTVALHPYLRRFFSRDKAYDILGFDAFHSEESFEGAERMRNQGYVSDMAITERIIAEYEASAEKGQPFFCHAVTMQNHAGYKPDEFGEETVRLQTDAPISDYDRSVIETYATCLTKTDAALGALVDYFEAVEEPTVIVFFGDHQPYFSDTPNLLEAIGYSKGSAEECTFMRQSTPYLIWNNMEETPTHAEKDVSLYHLIPYMTDVLELSRPAFHYFMDAQRALLPGVTRYVTLLPNGTKEVGLQGTAAEIFKDYWLIAYDNLIGSRYAEKIYQ